MPSPPILKKLLLVTLLAIFAVAGYGAWHIWGIASAPAAQAPLLEISQQKYSEFRAAFNAASDLPRITALLSPT